MPGKPQGKLDPRPLLSAGATAFLGALCEGARLFEFGSGGSTLWLAQRAARLVSIEHDADWHAVVVDALLDRGWPGVEVHLVPLARLEHAIDDAGEWDVVFVDCHDHHREKAIGLSAAHVKPGGWLVADDYDFPMVKRAVGRLRQAGWSVDIMKGTKIHAIRKKPVRAVTAFCHKPEVPCS